MPSWLGGPVAQVFDKGVETLGCVLGWITAGPQVVADVVACVEINATRDPHRYVDAM